MAFATLTEFYAWLSVTPAQLTVYGNAIASAYGPQQDKTALNNFLNTNLSGTLPGAVLAAMDSKNSGIIDAVINNEQATSTIHMSLSGEIIVYYSPILQRGKN
jgi:hypothetical protein